MNKAFKILIGIVLLPVFAVVVFTIWMQLTDYHPKEKESLFFNSDCVVISDTISVLTWNIGYGGLGDDMDFFYDGGTKMQTTKTRTHYNLAGIARIIDSLPRADFYFFQEVDYQSKRSYHINQIQILADVSPTYCNHFTYNYKVKHVPVPIAMPMGRVEAGLMTMAGSIPCEVVRYSFFGGYSWPKSLFMLDRCFLVQKHLFMNGDTLLLVNTHNTAYDDGGIRKQQMVQLKQWMLQQVSHGKHVIIGGDWNQIPTDIPADFYGCQPQDDEFQVVNVPYDFLPAGWQWAYDIGHATNRSLKTPYTQNSYRTILDFYIISPGLELIDVKTYPHNFKFSDHEPVYLKVALGR